MVKHTQTIRWQIADELLGMFEDFVGLTLKRLTININKISQVILEVFNFFNKSK